MQVILFRHGPAGRPDSERWPSDVDRPLTPRGILRTRAAARGLSRATNGVSIVLTSPFIRALGTARLAGEALGVVTVETLDALSAGRAPRGVFLALSKLQPDQTVVLVGHEPDLGMLAAVMLGTQTALPLKKAGACAIQFDDGPRPGGGELLWHLPPRLLRRLGGRKKGASST
jgi:phosphohistidine phosphatase